MREQFNPRWRKKKRRKNFLITGRAPTVRLSDRRQDDRVSAAVTEKLVAHEGVSPSSLTGMFLHWKWAIMLYLVG